MKFPLRLCLKKIKWYTQLYLHVKNKITNKTITLYRTFAHDNQTTCKSFHIGKTCIKTQGKFCSPIMHVMKLQFHEVIITWLLPECEHRAEFSYIILLGQCLYTLKFWNLFRFSTHLFEALHDRSAESYDLQQRKRSHNFYTDCYKVTIPYCYWLFEDNSCLRSCNIPDSQQWVRGVHTILSKLAE